MNYVAVRHLSVGEGFNPAPVHLSLERSIESEPLTSTARGLYCTLVKLAMLKGYAWPSIQYLCRASGKSRSTIKRAIHALEKGGYIAVVRPTGKSLSEHKSCLYVVLWQSSIRSKLQTLNRRVLRVSVAALDAKMNPRSKSSKIAVELAQISEAKTANKQSPGQAAQPNRGVKNEPSHIRKEEDINARVGLSQTTQENVKNYPFNPEKRTTREWIEHFAPKTHDDITKQKITIEQVCQTMNELARRGDPILHRPYELLIYSFKMPSDCRMRLDIIESFPHLKTWIEKQVI